MNVIFAYLIRLLATINGHNMRGNKVNCVGYMRYGTNIMQNNNKNNNNREIYVQQT